ncbi:hypothetical protein Zm00014a_026950 [Zea mays]|uniref:Uncharacterized protein n=1 Tax=Zea mays TaxID=4577 RepID=A0A317YJS4_MAIZE|nr:hypothetical protein Zm00014a_026950 [Zea mays]
MATSAAMFVVPSSSTPPPSSGAAITTTLDPKSDVQERVVPSRQTTTAVHLQAATQGFLARRWVKQMMGVLHCGGHSCTNAPEQHGGCSPSRTRGYKTWRPSATLCPALAFIYDDRATTTTTLHRTRGSAGLATICSSHTTLCALVAAGP